jgi:hypothetical protein
MIDAIDELIAHRRQTGSLSPMLRRVHRFHRANPQVLDFLVSEIGAEKASGWAHGSLGSLWHHARWVLTRLDRAPGEGFTMSNNLFPMYGRIIILLHPDINGFFSMKECQADRDLGTRVDGERLVWGDGTAIENGWRPTTPHEPKPVIRRERVTRAA